jgi:putative methyltransferase (TIGR04325 family)
VNHEAAVAEIAAANDVRAHNLVMTFAYVVSLSAEGSETISVLDWGGGPGHYYAFARALLPRMRFDYHIRDLPVFVSEGQNVLPSVTFYEDDRCLLRSYDLVVASSSLQYSENWQETFESLARASSRYLYVTRLPMSEGVASFVVLQRAGYHGYGTEYLGWVINRGEFLELAEQAGLQLVREFVIGYSHHVMGAPETPVAQSGFLFRKSPASQDDRS